MTTALSHVTKDIKLLSAASAPCGPTGMHQPQRVNPASDPRMAHTKYMESRQYLKWRGWYLLKWTEVKWQVTALYVWSEKNHMGISFAPAKMININIDDKLYIGVSIYKVLQERNINHQKNSNYLFF